MGELKKKTKEYQAKMKKVRDDPDKMMKLQKEAMEFNLELMKHSFKPTLYTMIPILIIFGWLNAHMAFYNIAPQEQFTLTANYVEGFSGDATLDLIGDGAAIISNASQTIIEGSSVWVLQANEGNYKAQVTAGGATESKNILVSEDREYEEPFTSYDGAIESIELSNERVRPLEPFSLLGWHPGWLGTYILLSIGMSIGLRKLLGVV